MSRAALIVDIVPQTLKLADLHPRIRGMILEIWRHQNIITAYDSGQIILNYKGQIVKPEIGKVILNSCVPQEEADRLDNDITI